MAARLRIVAFDLGSHFAWASNPPKINSYAWGYIHFPGVRAHRLGNLMIWMREQTWIRKLDAIVYETPFARGRDATRSLWGMAGIIEACATEFKLPVMDVAVPTIKKFAAGHGKAAKVSMIKAARKWGYTGNNEHEADALCLLKYAEAHMERAEIKL